MHRHVGLVVAALVAASLLVVPSSPVESQTVPGKPLVANGSFEAPDMSAYAGTGGTAIERTKDSAFHGAHALAVTSGGSPSGVATATVRDTRPGRQLVSVALKGSESSTGQSIDLVISDVAGERLAYNRLRLTPWWQILAVSAVVDTPRFGVSVAEVDDGAPWDAGDVYVIDAMDAALAQPRSAEVSERRLFVDDKPYTIYGYTYGAATVGAVGLPAQANNVLSWHTNPQHCTTDANLMRAAGVNTLRITYLDVYDEKAMRCLDAFAAAGVGLLWLVNGPGAWQGTDLPAYEEGFRIQLGLVVDQVKDHPATLGYVIGNENSRTRPELQDEWFAMLDRLAAETKQRAPGHLTTVSMNSQQFWPNGPWGGVGPNVAPNIDLWGFNHYGNANGYPDTLWQRIYDQDPSRPVWMSEFGTDRYRCAQHAPAFLTQVVTNFVSCRTSGSFEDQQPQAVWDVAQWQDIAANLSSEVNPEGAMVGGTLFMWSDMWWFSFPFFTGSTTTVVTHDVTGIAGTNPINGQPNNFIRAHFPDQHFSPEWIGVGHVLRVDQQGPRVTTLAYDAMGAEYTGTPGPAASETAATSIGACAATVSWATDVPTFSRVDYGRVDLVEQGELREADNTIADKIAQGTEATTVHEVTLTGLLPATTYRAYVRGFASDGRSGTAPALEFTTAAVPDGTCGV